MNVIALGFFDGVHIGHAALLKQTATVSSRLGLSSCAMTFDIQPKQFIYGESEPLINTADDREYLLRQYVQRVLTLNFDERLMRMEPRDFISEIIKPNAAHVIAGEDFRFGHKGAGTSANLVNECEKLGIGCDIVPLAAVDGTTASSTLVRRLIAEGDMERAIRFLGHAHILSGIVKHGQKLGTSIGSPTVNIEIPKHIVKPAYGVYLTHAFVCGQLFPSITNVGVRPTVAKSEINCPNAETTIFGFSGDLYGEHIRIEFLKFMREERCFDSIESLKAQIAQDINTAKSLHFR
jgi:riboflavin kinase/FMN adenylyltransferase